MPANEEAAPKDTAKIFRQGVLFAVLNPKVTVLILAFLPQFTEAGAGPISAQLFLHGFLIVILAAFLEPPLILAAGKLTTDLSRNKNVSKMCQIRWIADWGCSL